MNEEILNQIKESLNKLDSQYVENGIPKNILLKEISKFVKNEDEAKNVLGKLLENHFLFTPKPEHYKTIGDC